MQTDKSYYIGGTLTLLQITTALYLGDAVDHMNILKYYM